jgi:hypothetical protein
VYRVWGQNIKGDLLLPRTSIGVSR